MERKENEILLLEACKHVSWMYIAVSFTDKIADISQGTATETFLLSIKSITFNEC